MSDAAPDTYSNSSPAAPSVSHSSRDRFELSRTLAVGLPNDRWCELGAIIDERCLLLVYRSDICSDRLLAEVAWVDERLIPEFPFIVVGNSAAIREVLVHLPHSRARTYQDAGNEIARTLSPKAPRTAYLVDPAAHVMIGVNDKDHLFDLGREIRDTDERGSDRVLDLGDVFR